LRARAILIPYIRPPWLIQFTAIIGELVTIQTKFTRGNSIMAVDDIYQLSIDQAIHGVLISNVFHYEQTGPGGTDPEQSLIDAWQSDTLPDWKLAVSIDLVFACARSRQVSGVGSFPETFEILTAQFGALAAGALPANAVAVISWYSSLYTKSGRGRSFLSGILIISED
jgi:hypothetical protein